jgi:hypothetical protein
VRVVALGCVAVIAHLQRNLSGDSRAPDFGWEIRTGQAAVTTNGFESVLQCAGERYRTSHPVARLKRRGRVEVSQDAGKDTLCRYWRCTADEKVPMQQAAWQRAELVIAPAELARLTPTLESPHRTDGDWRLWNELYDTGPPLDLTNEPTLSAVMRFHHDELLRCMVLGDDWGNLTTHLDGKPAASTLGMNRLNHCPPIFEEARRTGDRQLLEAALLWCDNFHDQSIWWGPGETGGARYNDASAQGVTPPDNDRSSMWRSNNAVSCCTKGFDSFFPAYEQTGDPRMMEALQAQLDYVARHLHAGLNTTRNIGIVHDLLRLYRFTGERRHLDESLRLFRELRAVLSTGNLFSESGKPIVPDPPFIEDDQSGLEYPYAKPYILGYAPGGLPELAALAPKEPKLRDLVRAVADFLVTSQDPVGGGRYPHPRSSVVVLSSSMETAWQLTQADRLLGPKQKSLDAIERVLRQRILGFQKTGKMFSNVRGWEVATGKIQRGQLQVFYALYRHPADRDFTRDYREGRAQFGFSDPGSLVYFSDTPRYYLKHRSADRLLKPATENEPLGKVLGSVAQGRRAGNGFASTTKVGRAPDPPPVLVVGRMPSRCELCLFRHSAKVSALAVQERSLGNEQMTSGWA